MEHVMRPLVRVCTAEPLDCYHVRLTFEDDRETVIDLAPFLHGSVFEPLRDWDVFRQVRVASGTITWPNGADLDPDVLYYGLTPAAWDSDDTSSPLL